MQPDPAGTQIPSETFGALEDAVSVVDRGLRLIYVNDAFCALVGWPRPVLLGAEPPMPWWTADEAERAAELMRQLMDGLEIEGPSEERVYRHRSGREVPVSIRSSLLRDDAGAVTALVAFTRAIGEPEAPVAPDAQRTHHEQLARAEEAQRVAAQTTAAITQELDTPIGVIRDQAATLAAAVAGTEHEAAVAAISGAAERLEQMTRDLVAISQAPTTEVSVDLAPVDLAGLTLSALAEMGHEADRRGVRLRGDVASSAVVRGDATRLRQVLESMVSSALQRAPQASEVYVGLRCGGGWAVLVAEDRGSDLEASQREALFAAVGVTGPGIGLAIARSVSRAHGGELEAPDVPAGGRVLQLTLPLADEAP